MQGLNQASRQSIFFGVGYVVASRWNPDAMKRLDFQKALANKQLDFAQTRCGERNLELVRSEPSTLVVRVVSLGPNVSNIEVRSDRPAVGLELFGREAEAVYEAYQQTWLQEQCQILKCSATIRHLYSCGEHAFKYLWEERLGQQSEDLRHLGQRPVLGGGLRLVMPPVKGDKEPVQIEIKVESFFRESNKIYIETLFVWPQPRVLPAGGRFDPDFRLSSVEKYAINEVFDFVRGGKET